MHHLGDHHLFYHLNHLWLARSQNQTGDQQQAENYRQLLLRIHVCSSLQLTR